MRDSEFFGELLDTKTIGRYQLTLRRYERESHIPRHEHREPYLTVVTGCGYEETWHGGSRACAGSDLILHPAGERHADRFGTGRTCCLDVHGVSIDQAAHLTAMDAAPFAARIYDEFHQPDEFSPAVLDALLLEISVAARRGDRRDLTPLWLQQSRRLIEADFRGNVALGGLAARLNVHPAHLARSFRHHYGCTIGERVRELRVAFARRRLLDGASPRMVAIEAGFADQSHLTRSFRRVMGVTPAAFQRLHATRVPKRD